MTHTERELYQALVETTGTGYVVLDESGKVIDANQEYLRLAGYSSLDQIRGRSVVEWTADHEKKKNAEEVHKCLIKGVVKNLEIDYVDKNGKITPVEINARTVEIDGSRRILTLCRDISERRFVVNSLRQAESRLRSVIHAAPVGIGMVSNRMIMQVNDQLCQMTGYSPDDLIGKSARVLYPSDEEFEFVGKEKYRQIDDTGSGVVETKWKRKDGAIINILLRSTALDKEDLLLGVIFTAMDITGRKQTEYRINRLCILEQELFRPATLRKKAELITQATVEIFQADFARIWFTRPGDICDKGCFHAQATEKEHVCQQRDCCLHLFASSGRYTRIDGKHARVPFGCYKIGRVAAVLESGFMTNDVTHDPRVHDHEWARQLGLVSFAGYKLQSTDGQPIGVLALFSKHALLPEDCALLETIASVASQIGQEMTASEALQQSEEKYQNLFKSVADAVFVADPQTRLLIDCNTQAEKLTGYTRKELLSMKADDLHPKEIIKEAMRGFRGYAEGQELLVETEVLTKEGKRTPVSINGRLFHSGGKTMLLGVFRDVAESKKAEEFLRQSQQRLQAVLDRAPFGAYLFELREKNKLVLVAANPATDAMTHIKNQDLIGKTIEEAFPGLKGSQFPKIYREFAQTGQNVDFEDVEYDAKGIKGIFEVHAFQTEPGKMAMFFRDVSDERRAAKEAADWKKRYELVSAASGQLIYDYDLSTGTIVWGGSVQQVLGYRPEEMSGGIEQWISMIDPADRDRAVRLLQIAEKDFLPYQLEYGFRHKNGNYIRVLDRGFFTPVPGSKPDRMIGTMQDITIRKETEKQLRQAYEQLQEAQRDLIDNEKMAALGRFAAGIAHEMKNPLGIMLGGLEYLERTALAQDAGAKDAIGKIKNAMHRGDAIIQNLLTYSRPAQNTISKVRAADVVNDALASFKYKTSLRNVKFKTRLDDSLYVEVDAPKIHQVLFNLFDNAMDAVPDNGKIEAKVYEAVIPDFSAEPACVIEVADNGAGIADESFPKLFEPFFTTKLDSKGTGLGLFMAKSIIDSHGGKISIDSRQGRGTVVKIVLRQAAA